MAQGVHSLPKAAKIAKDGSVTVPFHELDLVQAAMFNREEARTKRTIVRRTELSLLDVLAFQAKNNLPMKLQNGF